SLSELGLSDEEIEMLGMSSESEATAPTASEEPDLMPFSLDTTDAAPAAPTPIASEEPDLMPFSLEEGATSQPQAETPPAPTPAPTPAAPSQPAQPINAADDLLAQYQSRVDNDPENYSLRLSVARASLRLDRLDMAVRQYKQLIRRNMLLDDIVDDLNDMIADNDDDATLRQLHRVLGDAYTAQGHLEEAMDVYSWIPGKPKITRS
ncbi:MAG TPA: hypothetical protein VFT99_22525, partial [Roseiflexaceae bacterium]|nr:hypothetical protein [Roseiflexaceae bacterium]